MIFSFANKADGEAFAQKVRDECHLQADVFESWDECQPANNDALLAGRNKDGRLCDVFPLLLPKHAIVLVGRSDDDEIEAAIEIMAEEEYDGVFEGT
jgi:hypothetical protein